MSERLAAILDQLEAEQQQTRAVPAGVGALDLLRMVYRGEAQLSAQQIRAAIGALPFENPKLSAVAVTNMNGRDFADRLDRAIERSAMAAPGQSSPRRAPLMIEDKRADQG